MDWIFWLSVVLYTAVTLVLVVIGMYLGVEFGVWKYFGRVAETVADDVVAAVDQISTHVKRGPRLDTIEMTAFICAVMKRQNMTLNGALERYTNSPKQNTFKKYKDRTEVKALCERFVAMPDEEWAKQVQKMMSEKEAGKRPRPEKER